MWAWMWQVVTVDILMWIFSVIPVTQWSVISCGLVLGDCAIRAVSYLYEVGICVLKTWQLRQQQLPLRPKLMVLESKVTRMYTCNNWAVLQKLASKVLAIVEILTNNCDGDPFILEHPVVYHFICQYPVEPELALIFFTEGNICKISKLTQNDIHYTKI